MTVYQGSAAALVQVPTIRRGVSGEWRGSCMREASTDLLILKTNLFKLRTVLTHDDLQLIEQDPRLSSPGMDSVIKYIDAPHELGTNLGEHIG